MNSDLNDDKLIEFAKDVFDIEIESIAFAKSKLDIEFAKAIKIILATKGKIIITGMGKSGHVGKKIAATMSSIGTLSIFVHPAEALHGDLGMISSDDTVIIIGKSGESEEVIGMLPTLKKMECKIIAITANLNSTLAQKSDVILNADIVKEACPMNLAPTSSTTVALVIGDAIATVLATVKNFKEENYALFHPGGRLGKRLLFKVTDFMYDINNIAIGKKDDTIKDIIIKMSEKNEGAAVILDGESLVGIITDGDIKRILTKYENFSNIKISEVMTKNPRLIDKDMMAYDALLIMKKSDSFSVLPIMDGESFIGLLRLHDLLRAGL